MSPPDTFRTVYPIAQTMRDNGGMDILLNGENATIDENATVQQLLDARQLAARRVAVEVNAVIIPRSQHAIHQLQAGDRVEIVHALGGG